MQCLTDKGEGLECIGFKKKKKKESTEQMRPSDWLKNETCLSYCKTGSPF